MQSRINDAVHNNDYANILRPPCAAFIAFYSTQARTELSSNEMLINRMIA